MVTFSRLFAAKKWIGHKKAQNSQKFTNFSVSGFQFLRPFRCSLPLRHAAAAASHFFYHLGFLKNLICILSSFL